MPRASAAASSSSCYAVIADYQQSAASDNDSCMSCRGQHSLIWQQGCTVSTVQIFKCQVRRFYTTDRPSNISVGGHSTPPLTVEVSDRSLDAFAMALDPGSIRAASPAGRACTPQTPRILRHFAVRVRLCETSQVTNDYATCA